MVYLPVAWKEKFREIAFFERRKENDLSLEAFRDFLLKKGHKRRLTHHVPPPETGPRSAFHEATAETVAPATGGAKSRWPGRKKPRPVDQAGCEV